MLLTNIYQLVNAAGIVFPVTIFFAKVSILLLYLRIFSINTPLRISVHIGMLVMALFYTATAGIAISSVIRCVGLAAQTLDFCNTTIVLVQLLNSIFNVVTDFWILLLPMPHIMKIQLPNSRKIGLFAVFAAGLA